jgi:hypothetical protein
MVTAGLIGGSARPSEWSGVMLIRIPRLVVALVGLLCAIPAKAEEMRATEARQFVAGKPFAYRCFDGTIGNGRIYADGSVAGYIQIGGSGPRRYVVLPTGTLRVRGDQYCASLRGIPFEPCFNLNRTSQISFRGSISGLSFAYCDFQKGSARADLHRRPMRRDIRAEAIQQD